MTVSATGCAQYFTALAKTPEKYVDDARRFIEVVEQAGAAALGTAERIMGQHVLKDLEDSAEHFVYAAVTSGYYSDDMHRQIEEKAEQAYGMAERLRQVLR